MERLSTPGQFLLVGIALVLLGGVLLATERAELWKGVLVLGLAP